MCCPGAGPLVILGGFVVSGASKLSVTTVVQWSEMRMACSENNECGALLGGRRAMASAGGFMAERLKRLFWPLVITTLVLPGALGAHAHAQEETLAWRVVRPQEDPVRDPVVLPANLLPHSEPAIGSQDIRRAWLAGATNRYPHGVLGDRLEAGTLMVETRLGELLSFELPEHRVFEDLVVRLVDLDQDGRDEMLVVEADAARGAALAVFGIVDGRIARTAATEFIGQRNRWLNPLGAGDFDGDGRLDVALVATPHIGGVLRLYRFEADRFEPFAEYRGVSTHAIGSTELGLGRVVGTTPRDRILIPEQTLDALQLLEWVPEGWRLIARTALPERIRSSPRPVGNDRWQFELIDGRTLELELQRHGPDLQVR